MTTNYEKTADGSGIAEQLSWFKSSHSNGAGGECVECATAADERVFVRDSKRTGGDIVTVSAAAWVDFLSSITSAG
ncbi:DUF397 domain-containing protein [Streptomyces sp. Q6]|uniref:DUF397 domain-containing protein n=1 Tax=Streptomyces citrinus TaxID=3118173 RepID=A0ACD5ABK1_9ACTN